MSIMEWLTVWYDANLALAIPPLVCSGILHANLHHLWDGLKLIWMTLYEKEDSFVVAGMIARDNLDVLIDASLPDFCFVTADLWYVEATAILWDLREALRCGWSSMLVELDCQVLVNELNFGSSLVDDAHFLPLQYPHWFVAESCTLVSTTCETD